MARNGFLDTLVTSVVLLPVILGFHTTPTPTQPPCRLSEFQCSNSKCVPVSFFCNSVDDCGDLSDEPRFCTPCNRTYYGDLGKTYEIELHRPREDRLPFVCHLTLTAGSGELGDIVQVTFESFTLGRFTGFLHDGCPDGDMQVWEWERPRIGGSWCGTSWGPSVYYSETRSVTVTLTLRRISKDQDGYNFDFRLGYKMLPKLSSIVRYGGLRLPDHSLDTSLFVNSSEPVTPSPDPQHYLGDLIGGTFCSRVFTDCNRRDCRLQSPNFPGIYPRNLTCYYAIRQQEVPQGKYALISVSQPKGQLINIRSQAALYGRANQQPNQSRHLKVWKECDEVQDYVTVYDGYTTRDPVLLKFCGGGVAVPEAVSSTHELLVEFSTSPFGTFLYPAPPMPLHGFQLQVQVKFVDKESPKYARNKRCEFWLRGAGKGVLESPRHSLAANTTCLYHLQGMEPGAVPPPRHLELSRRRTQVFIPSRFKVWLAVLKYHVTSADEKECSTKLQVWDGNVRAAPMTCNEIYCEKEENGSMVYSSGRHSNLTLLARYCKDHIPRSCDHSLLSNGTRAPRPCSLAESFLSSGDSMTLELRITQSTALRPVSFRALYEFVDLHQDGEAHGAGPCSRRFTSRSLLSQGEPQNFTSPKDVFLFGRGGNTNLSCVYRFEAQRGESVRITVHAMQTANRTECITRHNQDSGRLQCVGNATAHLRIWEVSWSAAVPLSRDCICGGASQFLPFSFTSTAHIVEVHFHALHMTPLDDYRGLYFLASWEFIRAPVCPRKQKVSGISGELWFRSPSRTPDEVNCESQPWVILPTDAKYLYVQLRGRLIPGSQAVEPNSSLSLRPTHCSTKNRVLIHARGGVDVLVCPLPPESDRHPMVEVFSDGWVTGQTSRRDGYNPDTPQTRSILVEFLPKEPGQFAVSWMEISRRPAFQPTDMSLSDCLYRCPELDACINSSLWCDGVVHCPSGYDEALTHCLYLLQLPPLHLALWTLGVLAMIGTLLFVGCRLCRSRRGSRLKSLPSDTEAIVGTPKEVIC